MLVTVRLLKGFTQPLTYRVPMSWLIGCKNKPLVGSLVEVPFRAQKIPALITEVLSHEQEAFSFKIREIHALYNFPQDTCYYNFLEQASNYYALDPLYFYKRIQSFLSHQDALPVTSHPINSVEKKVITLSLQQANVVKKLCELCDIEKYNPTLLHGITGSGKTEIYKKVIEHTIVNNHKSVLFLVPEVSLAVQFTQLFRKQLPDTITVYGFHSATGAKEKKDLWAQLLTAQPVVIIGVHLPVFLPIGTLGVIIIDEEHDAGFQDKKHPKLNSKELACIKARAHKIPLIVGSATPALSTLFNVYTKKWGMVQLTERFGGALPTVKTVLLTNKQKRSVFWITKELEDALVERIAKKEQAILFINRRGYSFFIQCKSCGFLFSCSHCSVTLTLHEQGVLLCHYCNYTQPEPDSCTSCKAEKKELVKKGIGTQQLVALVQKLFPHARIARADADATINKKKWQQIISDFTAGSYDILVGTQTVTKGYHFPNVTLVGIIWADSNLSLPLYTSTEQTLQQLIQVAGRAGRQSKESLVIVQAMAEHPIFNYLAETRYTDYYELEIQNRKQALYPPLIRLSEIELRNSQERHIDIDAQLLFDLLHSYNTQQNISAQILGPSLPALSKIKNIHRRKLYIKTQSHQEALHLWHEVLTKYTGTSTLYFTPNPLS